MGSYACVNSFVPCKLFVASKTPITAIKSTLKRLFPCVNSQMPLKLPIVTATYITQRTRVFLLLSRLSIQSRDAKIITFFFESLKTRRRFHSLTYLIRIRSPRNTHGWNYSFGFGTKTHRRNLNFYGRRRRCNESGRSKADGAIDCFHNPDEGPSSGGRRICWIDGNDGAWKRIVGLNTRNKPRLFCAPCMIWTVHSSTRHEMCSRWQDGIDTEWGGVMNHQSEGLFSRKL